MQRDRLFESYQDLEAYYHMRPSYWVEPIGQMGGGPGRTRRDPDQCRGARQHGRVLDPQPAPSRPARTCPSPIAFGRCSRGLGLHPGGKVINTFQAPARASGSPEPVDKSARRFLIDFAGGNLAYYLVEPSLVQVVASASNARILSTSLIVNEHVSGFRAAIDVKLEPGQSSDLRAYLRSGERALTETWTYPWAME